MGSEIGLPPLERYVEIGIGTDMDSLMGSEILLEDGKVIAFRG